MLNGSSSVEPRLGLAELYSSITYKNPGRGGGERERRAGWEEAWPVYMSWKHIRVMETYRMLLRFLFVSGLRRFVFSVMEEQGVTWHRFVITKKFVLKSDFISQCCIPSTTLRIALNAPIVYHKPI